VGKSSLIMDGLLPRMQKGWNNNHNHTSINNNNNTTTNSESSSSPSSRWRKTRTGSLPSSSSSSSSSTPSRQTTVSFASSTWLVRGKYHEPRNQTQNSTTTTTTTTAIPFDAICTVLEQVVAMVVTDIYMYTMIVNKPTLFHPIPSSTSKNQHCTISTQQRILHQLMTNEWYQSHDMEVLIQLCPIFQNLQWVVKNYKNHKSTTTNNNTSMKMIKMMDVTNTVVNEEEAEGDDEPPHQEQQQPRKEEVEDSIHVDRRGGQNIIATNTTTTTKTRIEEGGGSGNTNLNISHLAFAIKKFLSVVCTKDNPLVLFLDDVQWADRGSIQLLYELLVQQEATEQHDEPRKNEEKEAENPSYNDNKIDDDDLLYAYVVLAYRPILTLVQSKQTTTTPIVDKASTTIQCLLESLIGGTTSKTLDDSVPSNDENNRGGVDDDDDDDGVLHLMVENLSPNDLHEYVGATLALEGNSIRDDDDDDQAEGEEEEEEEENSDSDYRQHEEVDDDSDDHLSSFTRPLTNALYRATMGNVFYCQHALEELVRRNVLYFDVMTFRWMYSESVVESTLTEICHSQDVVALVESKLRMSSNLLQASILRIALTSHTLTKQLLLDVLQSTGFPLLTLSEISSIIVEGMDRGLLLQEASRSATPTHHRTAAIEPSYRLSHDKVEEAAYRLLRNNNVDDQHKLLIQIGVFLLLKARKADQQQQQNQNLTTSHAATGPSRHNNCNYDWMWFAAVQHFNNVPLEQLLTSNKSWTTLSVGHNSSDHDYSNDDDVGVKPPPNLTMDRQLLATLNLKVANLCLSKASFEEAIKHLRAAIGYLDPRTMWSSSPNSRDKDGNSNYDIDIDHGDECIRGNSNLTLDLHNKLIEIEFAQGNHDNAKDLIAIVLSKAPTLNEKVTAYYTHVALAVEIKNRNYAFGIIESLAILKLYGFQFPHHLTLAGNAMEKIRLRVTLKNRPISDLANYPMITAYHNNNNSTDVMKLLCQLTHLCGVSKNPELFELVALRAIRWSLRTTKSGKEGVSSYLILILTTYSTILRMKGAFKAAGRYGALANHLLGRYNNPPSNKSGSNSGRSSCTTYHQQHPTADFLMTELVLHSGILPLQQHPFSSSLDVYLSIYSHGLTCGNIEIALSGAMHYPMTYLACGIPLNNSELEAKVCSFEDKAMQLHQYDFCAIFQCFRKVLYNLKGKKYNRDAMDEDIALAKLEGKSKDMTLRDVSIYRLFVACIFGDTDCMVSMIHRLQSYPFFDLPLGRQYLRLTYEGIAAYYLSRKTVTTSKQQIRTYIGIGKTITRTLTILRNADTTKRKKTTTTTKDLVDSESSWTRIKADDPRISNYHHSLLCLKAVARNRRGLYDDAIAACAESRMIHLQALMNEFCGLHLLEKYNNNHQQPSNTGGDCSSLLVEVAEGYLGTALWLYQDWGAVAKVEAMKNKYNFLNGVTRRASLNRIHQQHPRKQQQQQQQEKQGPLTVPLVVGGLRTSRPSINNTPLAGRVSRSSSTDQCQNSGYPSMTSSTPSTI
jgi:predicted ATPase